MEPLHLNTAADHQQSYRKNHARQDEAVNTVDSTFRRYIQHFNLSVFLTYCFF
jgi:hypothetical protein